MITAILGYDECAVNIHSLYLLIVRLWLGYSMIMGGQSVLRIFTSQELRDFFTNWFGNELGLPAPVFMAFLAKGTEFVGGMLLCLGLFTRISAAMIAFVMFMATILANIDYTGKEGFLRQDATVTISCLLFAWLLFMAGPGKYSVDEKIGWKKPYYFF